MYTFSAMGPGVGGLLALCRVGHGCRSRAARLRRADLLRVSRGSDADPTWITGTLWPRLRPDRYRLDAVRGPGVVYYNVRILTAAEWSPPGHPGKAPRTRATKPMKEPNRKFDKLFASGTPPTWEESLQGLRPGGGLHQG